MSAVGDEQSGAISPDFYRSISMGFQAAEVTADESFPLMRETGQRFKILSAVVSQIDAPKIASAYGTFLAATVATQSLSNCRRVRGL